MQYKPYIAINGESKVYIYILARLWDPNTTEIFS